jgi:hypothetical protein
MDTALAPLFMLEMLHDVRHEDVAPVKTAFPQGAIQEAARGPNKRTTGTIFLVAGLLADQHDRRRRGPLANNGLCRINVQRAALAARNGLGNLREFLWGPFPQILLNAPDLKSQCESPPLKEPQRGFRPKASRNFTFAASSFRFRAALKFLPPLLR